MDFKALVGKYLRLRQELERAREMGHRNRLAEELQRLERWLAVAGSTPFADTRPLEDA